MINTMEITVNGELKRIPASCTVQGLVADLALDARQIAVERNLAIVPRSAYGDTHLAAGDRVEIVRFIGGG